MTEADVAALADELAQISGRCSVERDRETIIKAVAALRTPIPVAVSRSDLQSYFNPARVQVAAFLLARDEADTHLPVPENLIQWATQLVKTGIQAEHSGDCTHESHACNRCIADRALHHADAILALSLPAVAVSREEVARIIDPGIFTESKINLHRSRYQAAYSRADAILRLLSLPHQLHDRAAPTTGGIDDARRI